MELAQAILPTKHGAASVVIVRGSDALVIAGCGRKQRFQLIGGKARANESPVTTTLRECAEETGLSLNPAGLEPLGIADYNKNGKMLQHSFFLYRYRMDDAGKPKSRGLAWVPISTLRSGKRFYWSGYKLAVRAAEQLLQKGGGEP